MDSLYCCKSTFWTRRQMTMTIKNSQIQCKHKHLNVGVCLAADCWDTATGSMATRLPVSFHALAACVVSEIQQCNGMLLGTSSFMHLKHSLSYTESWGGLHSIFQTPEQTEMWSPDLCPSTTYTRVLSIFHSISHCSEFQQPSFSLSPSHNVTRYH